MSQETINPHDQISEYWATYNPNMNYEKKFVTPGFTDGTAQKNLEPGNIAWWVPPEYMDHLLGKDDLLTDPWMNGRYALAAVAWGLIALVVLGVGAGP